MKEAASGFFGPQPKTGPLNDKRTRGKHKVPPLLHCVEKSRDDEPWRGSVHLCASAAEKDFAVAFAVGLEQFPELP